MYIIYILSILSISISIYLYVYIYVYTISIAISISISMICIIIVIYSTWVHVWVMYIVYIILRASPCFSFSLRFPAPHQVPDPHGDPWRDPDGIEPTLKMLGWMGYVYIYMSKHATCLFQLWGSTEQLSCRRDLYATRARKSPFAPSGEGSFLRNIYIHNIIICLCTQ